MLLLTFVPYPELGQTLEGKSCSSQIGFLHTINRLAFRWPNQRYICTGTVHTGQLVCQLVVGIKVEEERVGVTWFGPVFSQSMCCGVGKGSRVQTRIDKQPTVDR